MNFPQNIERTDLTEPRQDGGVLRTVASVKLGVVLIGVIAVVLICATLLEAKQGVDFANWYVYKSTWFIVLLTIFSVNILAAILVRFPWKNRGGFFLAHSGILVLLVGSIQTFWSGIDEQLGLVEGEKADRLHLAEWCQFTVSQAAKSGEKSPSPDVFAFQPGPFNWPEGKTFDDWQKPHDVKLKVLQYYSHARVELKEDWLPTIEQVGEPAIRFSIVGADGGKMIEHWLADQPLGGPGLPKLEIYSAPLDSMREDFLNLPNKEEDPDGVLSIHFDGKMQRIPVSKNLGKKIALEGGKIEVEIANYYANAKLRGTQFESLDDQPKNPILELKIYLPGKKEPLRELAAAKVPLMSFSAMHGKEAPVRFWYHQPACVPPVGIDFLRTPNGKMYCRTNRDGKYVSEGEVKKGSSIEMVDNLRFNILECLPFAKQKILPRPIEPESGEKNLPGAAALVEVESGGEKQAVWLVQNDPKYGVERIALPKENLDIQCGDKTLPLGFSIRLNTVTAEMNPGRMGVAAYISAVQLIDESRKIDEEREIRMNRPLTYGKFTFYQSGYNELPRGEKASILKVTYDPGRFLKYLGCWMICIGIALRYVMNSSFYKNLRGESLPSAVKAIFVMSILLLGISSAMAGSPAEGRFDWGPWRSLPVQDDGRQKPLDTLARESLTAMANRTELADPETGQSLDATAAYLSMLFDWQGWETSSSAPTADSDLPTEYFRSHKPDKWDKAPLIYVDSKELRKALGIVEKQKYISPEELNKAKITDPQTSQTLPFFEWAETVVRANKDKPSDLEKKGVELANRFGNYLADRMGQRMEIIPLKDDPHQRWVSLAMLMQAEFDDKVDPQGSLRKAKEKFLQARAAFRKSDANAFNEASTSFIATLENLGPTLGNYPSAGKIDLELSYNRWAPFRIAWILSLVALGCSLSSKVSGSKVMHIAGWSIFFASLMAMFVGFALRSAIGQRAPVTNMYESVLSVAVGIAIFGLIYELFSRKQYLLIASATLSALVILFAENFPAICDPRIRPLMPVLRNNFLLCIHVIPTMFSYAAFAVAWILANILLGGYLRGKAGVDFMNALSKLMLKIIRIGVFLLAVGTALGAYWGDHSWGRFWGWDPKEVWALITLLFYLNILHARHVGWLADFGTTVWSVISFVVVIMTWYGVNFVLNTGLHSYGTGSGGVGYYVLAGLIVQFLIVFAAIFIYYSKKDPHESAVNE
jgi:ABC-type transport system involved in cytochrome c biogenesis permease subunit